MPVLSTPEPQESVQEMNIASILRLVTTMAEDVKGLRDNGNVTTEMVCTLREEFNKHRAETKEEFNKQRAETKEEFKKHREEFNKHRAETKENFDRVNSDMSQVKGGLMKVSQQLNRVQDRLGVAREYIGFMDDVEEY